MSCEDQPAIPKAVANKMLGQFLNGADKFQPAAWYDPEANLIRYHNRPGEYVSLDLSPTVTLLLGKDNHPDELFTGFVLKSARQILHKFAQGNGHHPVMLVALLPVAEQYLPYGRSAIIRLRELYEPELLVSRTTVNLSAVACTF